MRPTRLRTLALIFLGVTGLGWVVLSAAIGRGRYLPQAAWQVDVALAVLILVVLSLGWRVRAYLRGRRPNLDPIHAAHTLVLAQAAALTGAILAGWYGAQVLTALGDWGIGSRRAAAIAALVTLGVSAALSVAGVVVERWCTLKGGSDTDGSADGGPEDGAGDYGEEQPA